MLLFTAKVCVVPLVSCTTIELELTELTVPNWCRLPPLCRKPSPGAATLLTLNTGDTVTVVPEITTDCDASRSISSPSDVLEIVIGLANVVVYVLVASTGDATTVAPLASTYVTCGLEKVKVAETYVSCGIFAVSSASSIPFRWHASTVVGVLSTVAVLPALSVSVTLFSVSENVTRPSLGASVISTGTDTFADEVTLFEVPVAVVTPELHPARKDSEAPRAAARDSDTPIAGIFSFVENMALQKNCSGSSGTLHRRSTLKSR